MASLESFHCTNDRGLGLDSFIEIGSVLRDISGQDLKKSTPIYPPVFKREHKICQTTVFVA